MAASTKVFDIVELLEQILLALPSKDMLLAQRVNKHFKATIEDSIEIQQALFFTTKPKSDRKVRFNPLLCGKTCFDRFSLAVDPNRLEQHSSAWRMIIAQSPKHWDVVSEKIFLRFPSTDYRTLMLQGRGGSSLKLDFTRVKSLALEYDGELLGSYWPRVMAPSMASDDGVVWYTACEGGEVLNQWIGKWDKVWWQLCE